MMRYERDIGRRVVQRIRAHARILQALMRLPRHRSGYEGFRLPGTERAGTALITGASSGIGAVFARRLAAAGYDLILVARREERLATEAERLEGEFKISAHVLVADLACPEAIERVCNVAASIDDLDLLINNAGFGTTGDFVEVDLVKHLDMITLHVDASVRLAYAVLPNMVARGSGGIINVSSITSFIPRGGSATYSATKSYLTAFSQALAEELEGSGVRVQSLCPGFTYTEFHDTEEYAFFSHTEIPGPLWTTSDAVVDASLEALEKNRVVCVPGTANQLLVVVARIGLTPLMMSVWKAMRRL